MSSRPSPRKRSNVVIDCAVCLVKSIRPVTHSACDCDWSTVGGRCYELSLNQSMRPDHPHPVRFIPNLTLDQKPDKHVQITHTIKLQRLGMAIEVQLKLCGLVDLLMYSCTVVNNCSVAVIKLNTTYCTSPHTNLNSQSKRQDSVQENKARGT